MPLRDHFRSPLAKKRTWEGVHSAWPTVIVMGLNPKLPPRYVAEPQVHLGSAIEVDVATHEQGESGASILGGENSGGLATSDWSPPRPTLTLATDAPNIDEYEVRVYDTESGNRLVAAVQIVSPSNKDRPEHRRAFVAKCAAMLQNRVCVAIVDLVTTRTPNLYGELLELFGQSDPALASGPSSLYAVSCRWAQSQPNETWLLEAWLNSLSIGEPLPTLPLWLNEDLAVPLDLEISYEETCRILRIT